MDDDLQARARALVDTAHDLMMEHRELRVRSDLVRRQLDGPTSRLGPLRQTARLLQQLASASTSSASVRDRSLTCALRRIVADLDGFEEHRVAAAARELLATFEETQVVVEYRKCKMVIGYLPNITAS